jgi:hypothetical protein
LFLDQQVLQRELGFLDAVSADKPELAVKSPADALKYAASLRLSPTRIGEPQNVEQGTAEC